MTPPDALPATFNPSDPSTPGFYPPSQTALLLLDFHHLFISKAAGPHASAAVRTATRLRSWAKSHGIQVIHCLIDVHATPFPTCKGFARLSGLVGSMASGEPQELVADYGDDATFTRRPGHVSALKSPGLEEFLHEKGIKGLLLAGLSTSGCVLRTAFAACDAEFVVAVVADGCADAKEAVHGVALELVQSRGYVVSAEQVRMGFEQREGGDGDV